MSSTQALLRRKAAATHIREKFGIPCAESWLAKLACVGGGPPYRLAGRIPLYARTPQYLSPLAIAERSPSYRDPPARKLRGKAGQKIDRSCAPKARTGKQNGTSK